jgi:hypothetical protein
MEAMQVDPSPTLNDPDYAVTLVIHGRALAPQEQRTVLANIVSFVDSSADLLALWLTCRSLAPYAKARLFSGDFFPTTRLHHLMVRYFLLS